MNFESSQCITIDTIEGSYEFIHSFSSHSSAGANIHDIDSLGSSLLNLNNNGAHSFFVYHLYRAIHPQIQFNEVLTFIDTFYVRNVLDNFSASIVR